MAAPRPAVVVGRYLPLQVAEAIHSYLMSRPCSDPVPGGTNVYDLVTALRNSKPLTREPR